MTHESTQECYIFGCIMGLALLMILPLPARAQVEQQQEVAAIMHAAVEHVYYNTGSSYPTPKGSLAERVKIVPPRIPSVADQEKASSESVSVNARKNLAQVVATQLGTEATTFDEAIRCTAQDTSESKQDVFEPRPPGRDCHMRDKNTEALMTASIPEISDSEARVMVEWWEADGGPITSLKVKVKLKREAEGKWQVTEAQPLTITN